MNKITQKIIGFSLAALLLTACGRDSDSEATPSPTPNPTAAAQESKLEIRVTIDKSIASLIDRYLEAQVVELSNGVIAADAKVVGTATRADAGHTQGLTNELVVSVPVVLESGKEYGIRAGVFDGQNRGTLLLTADCTNEQNCRYFPDSKVKSFKLTMLPAVDEATLYQMGVPAEVRAKCAIKPNSTVCGMNKTMQYYDEVRDTCYGASWGSCEETKTFKAAADCLQACRKSW